MPDRAGQSLGKYRLLRLLGRGGFAEVYLGEHQRLGSQAAIKILYTHTEGADEDEFLAEARTIARLVHPHIVLRRRGWHALPDDGLHAKWQSAPAASQRYAPTPGDRERVYQAGSRCGTMRRLFTATSSLRICLWGGATRFS